MFRTLTALCLTLAALPARAETFDVLLGDRLIGTMESRADLLRTDLNNTPFGIADGATVATLARVRADDGAVVSQYYFRNDERTVSVLFGGDGSVRQTEILPESEATEPTRYPADVRDPVGVVHGMVAAGGCPAPFRQYDGRRVAEGRIVAERRDGDTVACDLDYRVVAGPGHASPLGLRQIAATLTFQGGALSSIAIRAAGFTLTIRRQ